MKHCAFALAILILEALTASGSHIGVILQLSRASRHEEIPQLALWPSCSLRSEAPRVSAENLHEVSEAFRASVEIVISRYGNHHGSAAYTNPRVGHDAASATAS